ncbi:AMP-binding protein [Actinokineospora sp. NBRC 105648]|uniref:AMP-binding protein n=1 Tax=Actinokineospora sp. NBRC 105648 TaxID=3032206 RepID=UPI0024A434B4|nr:AMP-binding protein [Actinokineospora sp. NBRC 105648]GLZ38179.1 hypothetical protein Acsp05_18030 [Actinokineospora sp. NBRC 105648]
MRVIPLDGTTAAVRELERALRRALDGGPQRGQGPSGAGLASHGTLPDTRTTPDPTTATATGVGPAAAPESPTTPGSAAAVGATALDALDPLASTAALTDLVGWGVLPLGPEESAERMHPEIPLEPGTALVVRTSGSTGEAKGVLLSATALRASAEATHRYLGGPGTWLLAMPAQHIAGVQVIVRSIVAGTPLSVLPAGGFQARRFVEAAVDVLGSDGPRYTALVPTQLTRLLDAGGDALAALRSFDAVLVGGAATAPHTLARARDAGVRVVTTYGMSETAGGCVYDGVPLDGVQVRITGVDAHPGDGSPPERATLAPGGDPVPYGVIELGGPTLAHGYRLAPEATRAAFVDGWFRTSDLGTLVNGKLEVLGRVDDMINTGGVKIAPAAVERVLAGQPGVAEACVVGVPDPEWGQRVAAAIVSTTDSADSAVDQSRLAAAVRVELGAAAVPRLLRFVDALPLRGPGKVDRAAVVGLLSRDLPAR